VHLAMINMSCAIFYLLVITDGSGSGSTYLEVERLDVGFGSMGESL
jgi:hypothetical protein